MRPITAADVMNPEVLTVPDDLPVAALASFLVEREISGAPVADAAGNLVGVVSVTDIALAASGGGVERGRGRPDFFARGWEDGPTRDDLDHFNFGDGDLTVRDIMTPDVYAVPEDTPVPELAELMLDNHIHRLLVTRGEKVVGIVSTSDLLGLLVEEEE
jgi:CBS domain-containing protein